MLKGLAFVFKNEPLENLIRQGQKELDEVSKCFSRYQALLDQSQTPKTMTPLLKQVLK